MKDIKGTTGARIRLLRRKRGLTIEELAYHAGVHPNYLGDAERGRKNLSLESLDKIARGLRIPVSAMFVPEDREIPADDAVYKLTHKLAALLKDAPPRERQFIVKTTKFLLNRRRSKKTK